MKRRSIVLAICCVLLLLFSACSNSDQSQTASMVQDIRDITHDPKYSAEVWDDLGIRDRWQLLVAYEREVEKAMGLDPVEIVPFLDEGATVGFYSHPERAIYLSKFLLLDRDIALSVVRHELRHYYQNVLCDDLPENHSDIATKIIKLWDRNRKQESFPRGGPEFYTQPLEEDAYAWEVLTG